MLACVVGGAGPAGATDGRALLRVAHLSPDTPAVDVALAPIPEEDGAPLTDPGPDVAEGLAYGDVGSYRELTPGSYAVSVRAAGTGSRTPPSLSIRVDVPAGGARTVALSGSFADLSLAVLTDDLSAPGPESARLRVLAAAAGAPAVDVSRTGGPSLAQDLPFGAAGSAITVPAGRSAVRVDGGRPAELPLDLAAGSISTLLVLERPGGGLTLRVVLDAAGPAAVPTGAVPAGGGGTAGTATALALACLAAGGALACTGRRRAVLVMAATLSTGLLPRGPAAAEPAPPVLSVTQAATGAPVVPTRLRVPSAGVDTALTGIALAPGGVLVPPDDPGAAGWFAQGPAPGAPGPAVIAGHVDDSAGPAVFARLHDVAAGDPVLVTGADGSTVGFTVTRVARYRKDAFPTAEVYGPTTGAELRLITCGGDFDRARGSYLDNVVVYASAVR